MGRTVKALYMDRGKEVAGRSFAEVLCPMTLGAPIVSPARMQLSKLSLFACWEDEAAIDQFLEDYPIFSSGWHVRMRFIRRWGKVGELGKLPEEIETLSDDDPVIAFTLARMKPLQIPRFIAWGKPVEELVRDHPGQTFATAAIRYPNTVSTFSIWKTQREMLDMVHGHSAIPKPKRHADAMVERNRKDFHFEFTTLRFQPLGEYGERIYT